MQVQSVTLVDRCLDAVLANARKDFALLPKAQEVPPTLHERMVRRAEHSPKLLVELIKAGFDFRKIDLSNCTNSNEVLDLILERQEQPYDVTLSGQDLSWEETLDFASRSKFLRCLKIFECKWADQSFLDRLSKERPELQRLLLFKTPKRLVLSPQAAKRWSKMQVLKMDPEGNVTNEAFNTLICHGNLQQLQCKSINIQKFPQWTGANPLREIKAPNAHISRVCWLRLLFECTELQNLRAPPCPGCSDHCEAAFKYLAGLGGKTASVLSLDLDPEVWGLSTIAGILDRCLHLERLVLKCSGPPVNQIVSLLRESLPGNNLHSLELRHVEVNDVLLQAIENRCPDLRQLAFSSSTLNCSEPAWLSLKRTLGLNFELVNPARGRQQPMTVYLTEQPGGF